MGAQVKQPQHPSFAAIYCRVSSQGQEDNASLPTQDAACRRHAAERGYAVDEAHMYREVHSGAELWERPKLTALREALRGGEISAVICYALDRLSRKQTHLAIVVDECDRAGVDLLFVTEEFEKSAIGDFIRSAKSFAAELEREKIKERTQRGLRARVESGKLRGGGWPMYGYRWSDDRHSGYEIEPVSAAIVRRIFDMAALGTSTRAIALALMAEGLPSPRGKAWWSHTSVQAILRNEQYTGEARAFRIVAQRINGKETRRRRATEEQVPLPAGTIPPLIGPATFAAVQGRLDRNKAEAPRNHDEPERFLLRAGFVTCGYCGRSLSTRLARDRKGNRYAFYRASRGNGHEVCGHQFGMSAAQLDAAVWSRVTALLTEPDTIAAEIARQRGNDPTAGNLATIVSALAAVARQQANLTRTLALLDDADATAPLVAELNVLAARKRELEAEHAVILGQREAWAAAQGQLDELTAWCHTVATNLESLTYDERRLALRALDVRVRLWERVHEPRYEIRASIDPDRPLGVVVDTRTRCG